MFQLPKLKYKIDGSETIPGRCNLTSVEFNPCYPLIACPMYEKTYIIAYGGEPRQKRGQIIFVLSLENPSARYRCINWSPSGNYLLCLEEGQHMYPSLTCGTNRVRVLYYNSTTFCVNEIRFSSPLVPRPAMNTKFLWLDASTFIFADEKKTILNL